MNTKSVSPCVAVLITLYVKDDLDYFKEAIKSLIEQDYPSDMIRIYLYVDGPITEQQNDYLTGSKDIFYKIIHGVDNKGLSYGLNAIISSLGEEKYAFRMDADDISLVNRFSSQVRFMEENPEIVLSGCNSIEIDGEGKYLNDRTYPATNQDILQSLPKCMPILHPSFCIRCEALHKNSEYRYRGANLAEDIEFAFLTAKLGFPMANLQKNLIKWRISDDFIARRDRKRMLAEYKVYISGIKDVYGLISWRYIYPLSRLIFRMLPEKVVEKIYRSRIRQKFLR